jgi:hypothetical protein
MPDSDDDLYVETKRLISPYDADCWIDGMIISRKLTAAGHWTESLMFPMYVCPECGNKRCPKATWHEEACTHSNEPGQLGSSYGTLTDAEKALLEPLEQEILEEDE